MTITERVFHELEDRHLTQVALSEATGLTKSTISYIYKNNNQFPADAIIPIARFFGVSPNWVLTGDDEPVPIKEVIKEVPVQMTEDERELLALFREVDKEGKISILYDAYQQRNRMRSESQEKNAASTTA